MPAGWWSLAIAVAAALAGGLAGCLGDGGPAPAQPTVAPGCAFLGEPWDACDVDGDGVANGNETDADGDGISDGWEEAHASAGFDPRHADLCLDVLENPGTPTGVPPRMQQEFVAAYAAIGLPNPDGSPGIRLAFASRGTIGSFDKFSRLQDAPTTEPCIAAYVGIPEDAPSLVPGLAATDARNPHLRIHLGNVSADSYASDPAAFDAFFYNRTRALLGHEIAHFLFGCADIPAGWQASGNCGHTDSAALPCDALNQPVGPCWMPSPDLVAAKRQAGGRMLGGRPIHVTV